MKNTNELSNDTRYKDLKANFFAIESFENINVKDHKWYLTGLKTLTGEKQIELLYAYKNHLQNLAMQEIVTTKKDFNNFVKVIVRYNKYIDKLITKEPNLGNEMLRIDHDTYEDFKQRLLFRNFKEFTKEQYSKDPEIFYEYVERLEDLATVQYTTENGFYLMGNV